MQGYRVPQGYLGSKMQVPVPNLSTASRLGSFFTSAFFVSTEKWGPKSRIVLKNNVPVFPSQDFVTTSKKQAVVRTLSFFSYTRKTGTQKTGRSFQRCPRHPRYLFVAPRLGRSGPTRTKIRKRDNTTTNSWFMIDLVAEMLFAKKQHGVFALQGACKE